MIHNIAKLVVIFLLFTGDKISRSCCSGQGHGHLVIKISFIVIV